MSTESPIRDVVVAGDGIAAWSAAAALKRRIPSLTLTLVKTELDDRSIIDRVISTLPSIAVFHQDLGLSDADTIVRAGSALRIGTIFEGWSHLPDYVHAYGNYGSLTNGVAFHQLWLRSGAPKSGERFDQFSAAAELGRHGRISNEESHAVAQEIGYGLRLTIDHYQQLMRAFALHVGVTERAAAIADVRFRGTDGFIEELVLTDGSAVQADLFVDCSGPSAVIRSRMDASFTDWSAWLPCDRLIFTVSEPDRQPDLLDRATAIAAGWTWSASSPALSSRGAVCSSAHVPSDEVLQTLSAGARATDELRIGQGRWAQPWVRNCVAIGDAAVTVEPLELTNLHLAHNQIDRLVAMMPGRGCAPVELAEYNRQCGAEADRVRDFICMHYVTAGRDEPFWKDAAAIELPDSLAHTLSLFAERGRLPYYEEETFTRDSWLAVLLGQGFMPRRIDPLAGIFSPAEAQRFVKEYAKSVRSFVDAQPSYREYMSNVSERAPV